MLFTVSTNASLYFHRQRAFGFAFELGDVTNDGNALRYLVKAGSKMTFDYIFSYVAYIKGCRVGALPATQ